MRFQLGERVRFSSTVHKRRHYAQVLYERASLPVKKAWVRDPEKIPGKDRDAYTLTKTPYSEGVIVGFRHVSNGTVNSYMESDDGIFGGSYRVVEWHPDQGAARLVWLISFDLRRKPVLVFDEDVEALDG